MNAKWIAIFLAAAACLGGCALVPGDNRRLDEARLAFHNAQSDTLVSDLAPAELRRAAELLERASRARDTLDDVAVVDHLAYLARQRVAIARESAKLRAAGLAVSGM
jgi:Domain of unknown function (DUF4398)